MVAKQTIKDIIYIIGLVGFLLFAYTVYTSDWAQHYRVTYPNGIIIEGNCNTIGEEFELQMEMAKIKHDLETSDKPDHLLIFNNSYSEAELWKDKKKEYLLRST
jgi:hypothetical protein